LGFNEFRRVNPDTRRGLYLIECENHEIYIGVAEDALTRVRQHAVKHPDAKVFRFRPHPETSTERRKVERDLVQSAQRAGFIVRNREHASGVIGASVLNELVTEAEQKQWLDDPVGVNAADVSSLIELDPSQLAAHQNEFAQFLDHPRSDEIIDALHYYAATCIPYPKRTEATFWTVSCLPTSKVRLCVSMAMLETFYIAVGNKPRDVYARMFVDVRHLPPGRLGWVRQRQNLRRVYLDNSRHRSGGAFEQTLHIPDIADVRSALKSSQICMAAAHFNLDLMRRRQSGYKNSHCRQLAEAALTPPS
jgi:hypothetical protein